MSVFANRTSKYLFIGLAGIAVAVLALLVFFDIDALDIATNTGGQLLDGFVDWLEGWF